ncbi:hypothetical protein [Sphingopyxis sp. KK2]|uniref:hypothetical protein n=1 Tax=Sphingopyxis sp. KK2 TaxID=1855727 RepID=UPI0015C32144|nr:hypothetical protein [Sphingopyxis sp. KK2]
MRKFDYAKRARAVNEAQAAVNAAFEQVYRRSEDDPATRRWTDAIALFNLACERAYPHPLREVVQGVTKVSDLESSDILDFLEADPMFFRSGYMKERLLREIKKRSLGIGDRSRLQTIIEEFVERADYRREFLDYCRAAVSVDDRHLRDRLYRLAHSDDDRVALRANRVLAALDGRWIELKASMRRSLY